MNATDFLEKLDYVDKTRMVAAGASFGGFMIDWIATHTDRFKALVSHDGVYDNPSMYGETEELWFDEWEFKGLPWEKESVALRVKWSPSSLRSEHQDAHAAGGRRKGFPRAGRPGLPTLFGLAAARHQIQAAVLSRRRPLGSETTE